MWVAKQGLTEEERQAHRILAVLLVTEVGQQRFEILVEISYSSLVAGVVLVGTLVQNVHLLVVVPGKVPMQPLVVPPHALVRH